MGFEDVEEESGDYSDVGDDDLGPKCKGNRKSHWRY